ncbi:hypothetical protein GW17_00035219 [Ensete ventricosum]|nr:hypothetical protein GW17_00035219 [Ensete ventricosum]
MKLWHFLVLPLCCCDVAVLLPLHRFVATMLYWKEESRRRHHRFGWNVPRPSRFPAWLTSKVLELWRERSRPHYVIAQASGGLAAQLRNRLRSDSVGLLGQGGKTIEMFYLLSGKIRTARYIPVRQLIGRYRAVSDIESYCPVQAVCIGLLADRYVDRSLSGGTAVSTEGGRKKKRENLESDVALRPQMISSPHVGRINVSLRGEKE